MDTIFTWSCDPRSGAARYLSHKVSLWRSPYKIQLECSFAALPPLNLAGKHIIRKPSLSRFQIFTYLNPTPMSLFQYSALKGVYNGRVQQSHPTDPQTALLVPVKTSTRISYFPDASSSPEKGPTAGVRLASLGLSFLGSHEWISFIPQA